MLNIFKEQNILGLKRGIVLLSEHDKSWKDEAAAAIRELGSILSLAAIDIQHIGSTAICEIHAKPIIDIAVGVKNIDDILPSKAELENIGYRFGGLERECQYLFVKEREGNIVTHHVHITEWGGREWNNYIHLRDYLRTHKDRALAYDKVKLELQRLYTQDRSAYTSAKQQIIDELEKEAEIWSSEKSSTKMR
ncbi:MAG: GrpB family protein [Clostridia bacterium]|nr:GrpB family protein [Clostridia bacterium]